MIKNLLINRLGMVMCLSFVGIVIRSFVINVGTRSDIAAIQQQKPRTNAQER